MHARALILCAIPAGLVLGLLASQAVPVAPRMAEEPAWRALIQPQYRMAYAQSYGRGPEDVTIGARLALEDDEEAYTLPPEYAAAERFARAEARAAAEADRRYRLAYAEATRPLPEPAAVPAEPMPVQLAEAESEAAAGPDDPQAKVVTVAALAED